MKLWNVADKSFRAIRPLAREEIQSFRLATDVLARFERSRHLVAIVRENLVEFEADLQAATTVVDGARSIAEAGDALAVRLNRRLLNVLTSFRMYLDHTETRLKRDYGKDSIVANRFLDECRKIYDSSFAYRFTFRLRNFAQHCGLPIGHIRVSERLRTPESTETVRDLGLYFARDQLLKEGGDVWGSISGELRECEAEMDIEPIIRDGIRNLLTLDSRMLRAERPCLELKASQLTDVCREVIDSGGSPAVGELRVEQDITHLTFLNPPVRVLSWLNIHSFRGI